MLRSTYGPQNGAEPTDEETSDVDRLAEITMPVLVVIGEEDAPTIQQIGRLIAKQAPQAQFASIADAAHSPSLERAERFNEILALWLQRTAG
ncbi:alpha/beta hydrolase fold protein [mine drainage metagenome]|uniref:Alpha/beta hydrolase fold protein n=1 Tax=mine drainage metagenome TaxID=410659 RepID=T1BXW5_9ZZZZ